MDLYRYFHPHHNPRLRKTSLRLQEIGELQQAASELRKAVRCAEIRTENAPVGGLRKDHFSELLVAMDYLVESLTTLTEAHPGDGPEVVHELLRERKDAPGWENWSRLLRQRLDLVEQSVQHAPAATPPEKVLEENANSEKLEAESTGGESSIDAGGARRIANE